MIYKDGLFENKAFTFFKQLMYNIATSICIILLVVLIMVFGFKYRLYEVLSDSQVPTYKTGDLVVVKGQSDYHVGDIIKYDLKGTPTTHRCIAIVKDSAGTTYYVCHGDNVQSMPDAEDDSWQANAKALEGKSYEEIANDSYIYALVQMPKKENIEGKVVAYVANYGTYFKFVKSHSALLIALGLGVWCISMCYQNEMEMKKARRLM